MIIAVWGNPGAGKSAVATELGRKFSKDKLTVVIDTDMTQPTLPHKLPKINYTKRHSLGLIFLTPFVRDAQNYLHQHPKEANLFYAGLTKDDNYFSYEVGINYYDQAYHFINACAEAADVVILDCSNQRGDPFIAAATDLADAFVLVTQPDIKNVCWNLSIRPFIDEKMAQLGTPIIRIASQVQSYSVQKDVEKLVEQKYDYSLPFAKTLGEALGKADPAASASGFSARKWNKTLSKVHVNLAGLKKGGAGN